MYYLHHNTSREMADFETTLKGRKIVDIEGLHDGSECVKFLLDDGSLFVMDHTNECCEYVRLVDCIGDDVEANIIGWEILDAYESVNVSTDNEDDSQTWTFYRITTMSGSITLRWLGESNGYYSERVDCTIERPR